MQVLFVFLLFKIRLFSLSWFCIRLLENGDRYTVYFYCIEPCIDIFHMQIIELLLLASQSDAHRIAPHRDPIQPIQPIPNPYPSTNRFGHKALVSNLVTKWRFLHWFQIWSPDGTCCIISKFGHQMAPLA